ncbi:FAD-dependent oxidoreductase [Tropicimonas sediminicola]|uniref:Succinate dehydrogenase/fumarate reductase, flavoprotein subunit n=1 Tax=Tropicimonas sediminicola TaxID=1031541 RepID=A0A239F4S4_9RHOB|nr:FAD-binding protein [Tropicimonas sediminicola]SNS51162.1 Succinate dehydrogenase/fumarate reductase, flavoprotein subunit [Tropicimonas sediminicola]
MNQRDPFHQPSRRTFLGLAGAATGLAAAGMGAGWATNRPGIDAAAIVGTAHETDVLVIGGGMAGLFAAVKAHDAGARVLMVSKGRLGASGMTPFAKGFFVFDPETESGSIDDFVDSVSRSALGTNNPVFTRQLAEHALERARELRDWGFFDQTLSHRPFLKPIAARAIARLERVMITHLIREEGRIAGAAGFGLDGAGEVITLRARAVVLCTGAGGFKPNGFPVCDLTHDGTVMAYRIGAWVTGKEWNDGHVTRSTNPAACFDAWGDMFERVPGTNGVEIHHDLGVDMNYAAYRTGNPLAGGPPGSIDTAGVSGGPVTPEEFRRRPGRPGDEGGPPERGGMDRRPPPPGGKGGGPGPMQGGQMGGASAGMAIHKSEGLVPVDDRGASTVPGLYAAGDALGSHMAGGIYTQIGSSLAGSAVQGAIAGEAAAEYARGVDLAEVPSGRLDAIRAEMLAPLTRKEGYGPAWVTQTLQGVMIPNFVLYIKKESLMRAALAYVQELRDHHVPMLRAGDLHELRLAHETANMIVSAEMKLRASLMRTESRCSHYRLDYPDQDDENWRAWITIHRGEDGQMTLAKQPFDAWPSLG